jgi:hypothetical protein
MNVIFPIKFKYLTIERGTVRADVKDAKEFEGYTLTDNLGTYLGGGSDLARLIQTAAGKDIHYEECQQFLDRKLPGFSYLDDVDIDRRPDLPSGLMMPGMASGGNSGPAGMH